MLAEDVLGRMGLPSEDAAFLTNVTGDLAITADVCRADLLLCGRAADSGEIVVVAQARPHSSSPLYEQALVGAQVSLAEQPQAVRGTLIAVMVKDVYWLAHERHRRRSKVFQAALSDFIQMVLRGELEGAEELSSFGVRDGIMYVDADQRIQYMSGIASELYRHLGYRDTLVGHHVGELETVDHQMVTDVATGRRCLELEVEQDHLTWVRKALPVASLYRPFVERFRERLGLCPRKGGASRYKGTLILIHDATQALKTQRELESKRAMVREVHHRVKNSLQVVASIMRMQARRTTSAEAKAVLEENVNRVLGAAVVHEFLSRDATGMINLQEVAQRIVRQAHQGLVDPTKQIKLDVTGQSVWLPAERATQCALIIVELVQNAIEHGLASRDRGAIRVAIVDQGEKVSVVVSDDGEGLPDAFDLEADANLGLYLVANMVKRDLGGRFQLVSDSDYGTRATVSFRK